MKLLVNLSPYLKKNIIIEKFDSSSSLEAESVSTNMDQGLVDAVSTYRALNEDFRVLLPLGGHVGKAYEKRLLAYSYRPHIVRTKDQSLEVFNIDDKIRSLVIKSVRPRLTNSERESIFDVFTRILSFSTGAHILYSDQATGLQDLYKKLIKISNRSKVPLGLYLDETMVEDLILDKPWLIILNNKSLEVFKKKEISTNFEVSRACRDIINLGVKEVLYVNGPGKLSLFTEKRNYRAMSQFARDLNINQTLAAYISTFGPGFSYEKALRLGLAAGISDLVLTGFKQDASQIKSHMQNIEVGSFNV